MQDPFLKHIRQVRARRLKELKRDFKRAIAESNERLFRSCDVVISPTGERQYVASKEKMYDVYIAPRLRRKEARTRG
jgi:glutamyl-tRNA reductase